MGVAVVTTEFDHEPAPDPTAGLVDAWATTRTMTHRSVGTTERGNETTEQLLRSPIEVVQRPPDRLLREYGEVSGRRDDRVLDCPAPVGGGEPECRLGPPGQRFDEVVDEEVAEFEALVTGEDPLYRVVARPDRCWEMSRTRYDPRSGFGIEARLCFADSGAIESVVIDHGEVVETTIYESISTEVSDEDLEP